MCIEPPKEEVTDPSVLEYSQASRQFQAHCLLGHVTREMRMEKGREGVTNKAKGL